MKRCIAAMLTVAMCVTILGTGETAGAAAKPKLSKKSLTLTVGASKTLKVTKANGTKVAWKSNKKKVAAVKKSGKYGAKVTAKANGKAVITAKVKKGKKTYSLKCNVTVKKKAAPKETSAPVQSASAVPNGSAAPGTTAIPGASANPTQEPATEEPGPVETPDLTSNNIVERYHGIFEHMGSSVNYNGWRGNNDLQEPDTLAFIKRHFNSFTLEDEMKPSSVMSGWGASLITKEEALALGYVIPDNYTEDQVPMLNLDTLDRVLEVAYANGLQMRSHVLMWHQQSPTWFFARNYQGNRVTEPEIMDARLEFYVRTMMKHIMEKEKELTGQVGSIVYAWDVTNEYIHRDNVPTNPSWMDVYGDMGLKPTYVKKAFQIAYDMLEQYNAQDKVTLFYNDYDTYDCADDIVALVNYINEGEKTNICSGIGMQTHVSIDYPTLQQYGETVDKFLATGLQVQITEMDVKINFDGATGQTNDDQAAYVGDLMKLIVKKHKDRDKKVNPKGITGVTLWGLCDRYSWCGENDPLLFGTSINDPKPSFEAFLNAANVWME